MSFRLWLECDVPRGVEDVAAEELREYLGRHRWVATRPGKVGIEVETEEAATVVGMGTLAGAWIVQRHATADLHTIASDRGLHDAINLAARIAQAETFSLSAPGVRSRGVRRLARAIARCTGLAEAPDGLLIRLRRTAGWEVLVSLSVSPLGDRLWRVSNAPAAMNAPLAAAIVRLTRPAASDRFLNLTCGTGTLAIERALISDAARIVALDIDTRAIRATCANADAAGVKLSVVRADATRLPLSDRSFDVVVADLPWGFLSGSHDRNVSEYRSILVETGRVTRRRARMALVTNEIRLMQQTLGQLAALWRLVEVRRIEQGKAVPGLFLLRRA